MKWFNKKKKLSAVEELAELKAEAELATAKREVIDQKNEYRAEIKKGKKAIHGEKYKGLIGAGKVVLKLAEGSKNLAIASKKTMDELSNTSDKTARVGKRKKKKKAKKKGKKRKAVFDPFNKSEKKSEDQFAGFNLDNFG